MGRVSRTHRWKKEVWSCTRDEGRPLEAGIQVQVSNHRKLLSLRTMVVSVAGKVGTTSRPGRSGEASERNRTGPKGLRCSAKAQGQPVRGGALDEVKPFDISKREVWEAFKKVKANQGAAGVDRQSTADFEAKLSSKLYKTGSSSSLRIGASVTVQRRNARSNISSLIFETSGGTRRQG
jgi:hypothetical protein